MPITVSISPHIASHSLKIIHCHAQFPLHSMSLTVSTSPHIATHSRNHTSSFKASNFTTYCHSLPQLHCAFLLTVSTSPPSATLSLNFTMHCCSVSTSPYIATHRLIATHCYSQYVLRHTLSHSLNFITHSRSQLHTTMPRIVRTSPDIATRSRSFTIYYHSQFNHGLPLKFTTHCHS